MRATAAPVPEVSGTPAEAAEQILAGLASRLASEPVASLVSTRTCTQRTSDTNVQATLPLSYRRNGMSIFVLLLYSGYIVGKVAVRFRSSTTPQ
jgi:hypothetical protein